MNSKKTKLAMSMGFAGLIVALYISVSTTLIVLLLGFLFVPPALALVSAIIEGVNIISRESKKAD